MRGFIHIVTFCTLFVLGINANAGEKTVAQWIESLKSGSPKEQSAAIAAIAKLGPKAKDAAPALADLIKDRNPELEEAAIVALGKIGPAAKDAIPILRDRAGTVYNSDRETPGAALVAIGNIKEWTPAATQSVLDCTMVLPAYFAEKPDKTLSQLMDLLEDDNVAVQVKAMNAFRVLADDREEGLLDRFPKVRAAVAKIAEDRLASADSRVARQSVDLFRTIDPDRAEKTLPAIVRLVSIGAIPMSQAERMLTGRGLHDDLRARAAPRFVESLADAAPAPHREIAHFLQRHPADAAWLPEALRHRNANVRAGAALAARGRKIDAALQKAIQPLLQDEHLAARYHAAAALWTVEGDELKPVLSNLIEGLRQENPALRIDAAQVLHRMGKRAEPARLALAAAMNDTEPNVRFVAAETLLALDPKETPRVVHMLGQVLKTPGATQNDKDHALIVAHKLGKACAPITPELIGVLNQRGHTAGRAAEVLRVIGPDAKAAIPALKNLFLEINEKFPNEADAQVALALADLGAPQHAEAARRLIAPRPRTDERVLGTDYLPRYPNETVAELIKLLDDPGKRASAMHVLSKMRTRVHKQSPKPAFDALTDKSKAELKSALVKALDDNDRGFRLAAANALAELQLGIPEDRLTKLVESLIRDGATVYYVAPLVKGHEKTLLPLILKFGQEDQQKGLHRVQSIYSHLAPETAPMLHELAKVGDSCIRRQAIRAFAAVSYRTTEKERDRIAFDLSARLKDLDPGHRTDSAITLLEAARGDVPAEALRIVAMALSDADKSVRARAATTLRTLAKKAKPAGAELRKALAGDDLHVAVLAAETLAHIDVAHGKEILPIVEKGLQAKDFHVAYSAVMSAGLLGKDAAPLLPRLLVVIRERPPMIALLAARTIVAIDSSKTPEVAERLSKFLVRTPAERNMPKQDRETIKQIHALLQTWGPAASTADANLLLAFKTERDYERATPALTLAIVEGPNSSKGADYIRRALRSNSDDGDCEDVLYALLMLKSRAKIFLPEVRRVLKSHDQYLRIEAIHIIANIGPDAKEAVADLERLRDTDPQPNVRKEAALALKAIVP